MIFLAFCGFLLWPFMVAPSAGEERLPAPLPPAKAIAAILGVTEREVKLVKRGGVGANISAYDLYQVGTEQLYVSSSASGHVIVITFASRPPAFRGQASKDAIIALARNLTARVFGKSTTFLVEYVSRAGPGGLNVVLRRKARDADIYEGDAIMLLVDSDGRPRVVSIEWGWPPHRHGPPAVSAEKASQAAVSLLRKQQPGATIQVTAVRLYCSLAQFGPGPFWVVSGRVSKAGRAVDVPCVCINAMTGRCLEPKSGQAPR